MNSFLITFKPQAESPKRGMPVEELERLANGVSSGQNVVERWRFLSHRAAKRGDRVFLLQQGKSGPAIIGSGRLAGSPTTFVGSSPSALVEFEALASPASSPLVDRATLKAMAEGKTLWNTQASGIKLPASIANQLERLITEAPKTTGRYERSYAIDCENAIEDLGTDTPDYKKTFTWTYSRDPNVRAEVLRLANGTCEHCGTLGFLKSDGTRYLECHHIIALANDGEDRLTNVIALCPNDHREAHFGRDAAELENRMIAQLHFCR